MPAEKTRADSLREYHTGASSVGAAQTDPDASLGGLRSGSEAQSMDITLLDPVTQLSFVYVAGGNEEGVGTLEKVDGDTIRWKCFGESYGPSVAIAPGETKVVETKDIPGAYLRISRPVLDPPQDLMPGTVRADLSARLNNVFAMDDVTSAEAVAGDTNYRATIIKNESVASVASFKRWIGELGTSQVSDDTQLPASGAGTIVISGSAASFSDWPEQGWCHIKDTSGSVPTTREIVYYSERTDTELTVPATGRARLGTSADAGDATDTIHAVPGLAIATDPAGVRADTYIYPSIPDESTAPSGVSWVTGVTASTGLNIGALASGEVIMIWWKREIPEDAVATTEAKALTQDSFEAA